MWIAYNDVYTGRAWIVKLAGKYDTEAEAMAAHPRCSVRFQSLHEGLV